MEDKVEDKPKRSSEPEAAKPRRHHPQPSRKRTLARRNEAKPRRHRPPPSREEPRHRKPPPREEPRPKIENDVVVEVKEENPPPKHERKQPSIPESEKGTGSESKSSVPTEDDGGFGPGDKVQFGAAILVVLAALIAVICCGEKTVSQIFQNVELHVSLFRCSSLVLRQEEPESDESQVETRIQDGVARRISSLQPGSHRRAARGRRRVSARATRFATNARDGRRVWTSTELERRRA